MFYIKPLLLLLFLPACAGAQTDTVSIPLPPTLMQKGREFSGLYLFNQKLLFLPQFADINAAMDEDVFIYTVNLPAIAACTTRQNRCIEPVAADSIILRNLQSLIRRIGMEKYAGLEAVATVGNRFYFTVETQIHRNSKIPGDNYYTFQGTFDSAANTISLDSTYFTLPNWLKTDSFANQKSNFEQVGPEAMAPLDSASHLLVLLEYNYPFEGNTKAFKISHGADSLTTLSAIKPVDFRVTDLTNSGGTLYALNFYYGDEWNIYAQHPGLNRPEWQIKARAGKFNTDQHKKKSYTFGRILRLDTNSNPWQWNEEIDEIPFVAKRNWEGVAKFGNGFLIISDDNKGKSELKTHLLYLQRR